MSNSLEPILIDVISKLKQGRFANEQAISQGIVLRVLQALGWDTFDTSLVSPEFRTAEGRADFALCHPATKPVLYIEVKPPGKAEDSVRQALGYAFQYGGVPMVILTDGKTWSFYLTMEQGTYEERRVYKLDLFERDAAEAAVKLAQYLTHSRVVSGDSLEDARKEYRSKNRRTQALAAIPAAWTELIEKGDELLVELIADAVESKSGIRPEADDITAFLSSLRRISPQPPTSISESRVPQPPQKQTPLFEPSAATRNGVLTLLGRTLPYGNAKDAMVIVLRELAKSDTTFLQRCSQHPDAQGRKRRYIAQTSEELYPDRPDLREYREQLPGGWLVATNLNNQLKKSIIRLAAEVAGLQFGKDVLIQF